MGGVQEPVRKVQHLCVVYSAGTKGTAPVRRVQSRWVRYSVCASRTEPVGEVQRLCAVYSTGAEDTDSVCRVQSRWERYSILRRIPVRAILSPRRSDRRRGAASLFGTTVRSFCYVTQRHRRKTRHNARTDTARESASLFGATTTESELLALSFRYGVQTVDQLDSAIEKGRFHEAEAFEDYFRFDYLESELDSVRELLAQL